MVFIKAWIVDSRVHSKQTSFHTKFTSARVIFHATVFLPLFSFVNISELITRNTVLITKDFLLQTKKTENDKSLAQKLLSEGCRKHSRGPWDSWGFIHLWRLRFFIDFLFLPLCHQFVMPHLLLIFSRYLPSTMKRGCLNFTQYLEEHQMAFTCDLSKIVFFSPSQVF